jgi:hypothetical protein
MLRALTTRIRITHRKFTSSFAEFGHSDDVPFPMQLATLDA